MGYTTDLKNRGTKRKKKATFSEDAFGTPEDSGLTFTKLRKFNKKHYMYHTSANRESTLADEKKDLKEKGFNYRTVKGKVDGKTIYRLFAGRLEDLEFFTMNDRKWLKEAIADTKVRKKKLKTLMGKNYNRLDVDFKNIDKGNNEKYNKS